MFSLFDQKERTLQGPAQHGANTFQYYNDSARSDVGNVRELLETWFARYPASEQEELKSRFKIDFHPTFFELYVYTLFSRLGYVLTIHPELENTTKRPDYLAEKDGEQFYIEVKFVTLRSQNEQSAERLRNVLLDAISKVDATNFLLMLEEIIIKSKSQPSGRKIIRDLNKIVLAYDPDTYTKELIDKGFEGMPVLVYDNEQLTIKFKLMPKSEENRSTASRAIGTYPSVFQLGNDSESLIEALRSKATRYGALDKPYLICINKQSVGLDIWELQQTLYGSLVHSWSTNPNNRADRMEFDGNGFFGNAANPAFTRVSAVYFTNVNEANLAMTASHAFRLNPFAKFPLNINPEIHKSLKELLNIAVGYPAIQLPC